MWRRPRRAAFRPLARQRSALRTPGGGRSVGRRPTPRPTHNARPLLILDGNRHLNRCRLPSNGRLRRRDQNERSLRYRSIGQPRASGPSRRPLQSGYCRPARSRCSRRSCSPREVSSWLGNSPTKRGSRWTAFRLISANLHCREAASEPNRRAVLQLPAQRGRR